MAAMLNESSRVAGPFAGNGVTTALPFTFKTFAETDIAVIMTNVYGGDVTGVLDVDYTVTLNVDQETSPGGTVTMTVAPATGCTTLVVSDVPYDQPLDLHNAGAFHAQRIEDEFDRVVMQVQQVKDIADGLSLPLPSDAALISYLPGGSGAVPTNVQAKLRAISISAEDFGVVADGVTDCSAAMALAVAYVESLGGGIIDLPVGQIRLTETLETADHGVMFRGRGEGMNYGTVESVTVTTPATTLLWDGGADPVVHFNCTAGEYKKVGGGIEGVFIHCGDGAGVATYGILVTSRDKLTVRNVQIFNPTEAGVRTECYSGLLGAAGSGYDVQHCMFENVNHAIDDTSNLTGRGLWLTGGQGNGGAGQGNSSFNVFVNTRWQSAPDYDAVRLENTDNNSFHGVRCNGGSGTGWALFLGCEDDDSSANPAACRYNNFFGVEAAQGVVARASQVGNSSSNGNVIFGLNLSNGGSVPTIETGAGGSNDAELVCHYSDGMFAPSTMRFPNNGTLDFTKKSDSLADSRTVTYSKLNLYEEGNLAAGTVKISGTSTAGAGTYSVQTGYYTRVGRMCFVVMEIIWSAHTGTGDILIEGLPFTALNTPRDILLNVAASNLTFGGAYLAAYIVANTKTMALKTIASGAAVAAVPMDTTGTLNISGCYLIET